MEEKAEKFGRYLLTHRLAVGGMAEIFLARSASIDGFEKNLVIKRVRPDLSRDEKFFSMFIDEARISISFTHPNIVQVFDFGKIDDCYYLAMEYINGCDVGMVLSQKSVKNHGIDPALALLIGEAVCHGLDYAHNQQSADGRPLNLVHRDISPGNIMLGYEGAIKIADFGVALAQGKTTQTQPGMIVGKLAYMSPEQAAGRRVDRRSDIFSTAVVLWELLVGRPAYGSTSDADFFERIQTADIVDASIYRPTLGKELDQLLGKALACDRDARFQTARDFGEALRQYRMQHFANTSGYALQSFLEQHRQALAALRENEITSECITAEVPLASPALDPGVGPVAGSDLDATQDSDEDTDKLLMPPVLPPVPAQLIVKPPPGATNPDRPAVRAFEADFNRRDTLQDFDWSPALIEAIEAFRTNPSLWLLFRMGKICHEEAKIQAADAFFRAAALKFAQRGMLAQALFCTKGRLQLCAFESIKTEIGQLPLMHGADNDEIKDLLLEQRAQQGQVADLLVELLADTPASSDSGAEGEGTPLFSYLDSSAFAEFAARARLRRFAPGQVIVREGEGGDHMFLIGQGRVLVYATSSEGQRVYLSSLTAGDFFGENGFFTDSPRSATVEALYPVDVFEIDRSLYDQVMHKNPQAKNILLQFYKDRIVETVMATSPVFGLLPAEDRRDLVAKFELVEFEPGQTIIREGDQRQEIYLIKSGAAEVYTEQGGPRTVLSTIGAGSVFGEVAVLRNVKRTATVSATTKVEALLLSGQAFFDVLASRPAVRTKILDVVAKRARENIDKVMGPSPFARNLPPR